jgi:hypothetical protein
VIGRWNKAPARSHNQVVDGVAQAMEAHTELLVERVIVGKFKPGNHKILLGAFIGWPDKTGGPIMSFTSTELVGDVKDVAESNLWFLTPQRSWDQTDPNTYLALTTYRGVQAAVLENYFMALAAKDPPAEIVKLLSAEPPIVIERSLKFLSGGTFPWPYGPGELETFLGVKQIRKPMPQYASHVEKLLSRKELEVRQQAAAVYAELAGKDAIPRLRCLLHDLDATVRAVAAGALVHCDDRASGDDIVRALVGRADETVALELIERLRKWKSPHAVPALIEYLQHDGFSYQDGYFGAPALEAQKALKERTGYDFPTDISASRSAWQKAEAIADAKERAAFLKTALPNGQSLVGKRVIDEKGAALMLTNRSNRRFMVLREATSIDYRSSHRLSSKYGKIPSKKEDFVELGSGATMRLALEPGWEVSLEELTVAFLRNGNEFGVNAWIGIIVLKFDRK